MKKIAITLAAVAGASLTAFSQGQVGFQNVFANGYVIESSSSHTATSTATTYLQAPDFTAQLWALTTPSSTVPGAVDQYGYIDVNSLTSSGFALVSGTTTIGGSVGTASLPIAQQQPDGTFSAANAAQVPNTVSQNTILAVVAWSGEYANLAAAQAAGAYIGAFAFLNAVGPASPTPYSGTIETGWNTLANSPLSNAQGDNGDLILTQAVVVPEPGTMALAALGGASMLLFRRRK